MTLQSIAAVQSRMAAIEARFPVPKADFGAVLAKAQQVQTQAQRVQADAGRVHSRAYVGQSAPGVSGNAPAGEWAAALPAAGKRWAGEIEAAAREAGVDPRLLAALTWAESGFRPDAGSHAGARGLTQLMPGTAAGLGVDPLDPAQNLRGGARYLRAQLDRFGSVELALAAYNAGPGRVAQAGGIPRIAETQAYVPRVLGYYSQLGGTR